MSEVSNKRLICLTRNSRRNANRRANRRAAKEVEALVAETKYSAAFARLVTEIADAEAKISEAKATITANISVVNITAKFYYDKAYADTFIRTVENAMIELSLHQFRLGDISIILAQPLKIDKEHYRRPKPGEAQERLERTRQAIVMAFTEKSISAQYMMDRSLPSNRDRNIRAAAKCHVRAIFLHENLKRSEALADAGISIMDLNPDSFCFGVNLPSGSVIPQVSCSVPSDANYPNMLDDLKNDNNHPSTLECALVGHNDDRAVRIDRLGYYDIRRFSTDSEVEAELLRLAAAR